MTTAEQERADRFGALFCAAYPDILRFAQRRVHPSHAEDVAAEVFTAAWRRLDDAPADPGDARAWLFGIARRCLLNARRGELRRSALAVRVAESLPVGGGVSAAEPDEVAGMVDLAAAWRRLPPDQQETLALAVFEGLTSPQAGRVLGITAVAYRLRLRRARTALRRQLDPSHRATVRAPQQLGDPR